MDASLAFTSVGCNRVVNALDWGPELVGYGGHNVVVLYNPKVSCTVQSSSETGAKPYYR